MKKRAAVEGKKQEGAPVTITVAMQQLMLPLLLAMDATKKGLLAFVQQMGMVALSELLTIEAAHIAGSKGRHAEDRTHHHWGSTSTALGRNRGSSRLDKEIDGKKSPSHTPASAHGSDSEVTTRI